MKVLLIDVDSKIPNLALMKISAYHKDRGNEVDIKRLGISYYPDKRKSIGIFADEYERVYVSSIFNETWKLVKISTDGKVIRGGTGFSVEKVTRRR
jgi:hypothetical protein